MAIGQEGGSRFGTRPGFLSLSIANTSQLPFVLRPFAARGVADAEKEAVELALARQRALGVDPAAGGLHVGVIDADARLV
jgi:hypothetical protein